MHACKAPEDTPCRPLVSIDASREQIEAVRTCKGKPEERQVLLCGPGEMGVCAWKDGTAFKSDVPNLTILSRKGAKRAAPATKKSSKAKGKPKKKAKGKAAPKAKAKAGDDTDDSSDEPDESSEEEPEEKKVAAEEAPAAAAKPKQAWLCIPFYRSLHAHGGSCIWGHVCGTHDPKLRDALRKPPMGITMQVGRASTPVQKYVHICMYVHLYPCRPTHQMSGRLSATRKSMQLASGGRQETRNKSSLSGARHSQRRS